MATFVERIGTANPLNGFDVGYYSSPTFADIDGDGDLDAFIGEEFGSIIYFENDGSGNFTEVTGIGNPLEGFDVGYFSSPTFADIDGDGDLDAFIGEYEGNINYFENDGSGNFTEVTGIGNPLDGFDVEYHSTPTFADTDGDGDLDAFIGEADGTINYFKNDGSGNFTEVTDGNPLDGVDVGYFSSPTFADIDGDGDLDAFIGAVDGSINYFENDDSGNFTEVTDGNPLDGVDVENLTSPTFADIDGDGDLDAFIGERFGKIIYFENTTSTNNPPVAVDDSATTDEDSLLSGNVLTNDSDAETDPLTVTEVNGNAADVDSQIPLPSGALLTLNSDGTFDYDPNGQFESLNDGDTASDSFTYTISDGTDTDTATVTVTIDGVDEAPVIPPNFLESDYTIFSSNISTTEYTVELTNSQPVYTIDGTATNDSLNNFLTEVVLELGGTVVKNGTINEGSLEHFGGNQNPSITENEAIDEVTIKIAGSGVGGQYKADFDNDADANAFQEFARDLLGTDPTKTQIFQFNGGTNGGNNNIRILTNDEIVDLNPELSDGLRTADSLEFKWSGSDTSGTQKRNNFDDFIGEMGDLFGGDQLTNADIHVIPTLNEAELMGTEVAISNGLGDTETWNFDNAQEAQNFLTFFDSTVDAFAV
ncbi:MAG: FG-GAP-like repeat-containing protein [Cyanobacteria bacterium P01_H01_bin.35]